MGLAICRCKYNRTAVLSLPYPENSCLMFAELRQLDALNAKQVRGPTAARYRGVWSSALLLLCWSTGRLPPSHQGLDFLVHLSSGTPPRAPGLIKGQDSGSPEAGQPKHSVLPSTFIFWSRCDCILVN